MYLFTHSVLFWFSDMLMFVFGVCCVYCLVPILVICIESVLPPCFVVLFLVIVVKNRLCRPYMQCVDNPVFSAILWWMFHCTYWSLHVHFLYTTMKNVTSCFGVIMVSRKGIASCGLVFSTGNLIALSVKLVCCRNLSLFSISCMTNVSCTYFFHSLV